MNRLTGAAEGKNCTQTTGFKREQFQTKGHVAERFATRKPRAHSHTQHEAVMEGLKTLQEHQTASLASSGTAITDMVSTVKEFMHSSGSGTSRKRKRDELSESDADEHEIDDEIESVHVDEAYERKACQ